MKTVWLIILSYDSAWRAQYQRRHETFSKLLIALWLIGRLSWLLLLVHIAMHRYSSAVKKYAYYFPCRDDGKPESLCPVVWCHVPLRSEKSFSGIRRNISWDWVIVGWHIFKSSESIICYRNSSERRKNCAPLYCRTPFPMELGTYSFQCWLHVVGVNWGTFKSKWQKSYSLVMRVKMLRVRKQKALESSEEGRKGTAEIYHH